MRARPAATLDTSIWIPFLRSRRYGPSVDRLVAEGRVWMPTVVLLELYAGTGSVADARAIDAIRVAVARLGRLYHPTTEDFVLAGRMLSYESRRAGRLRPRDHSHDLLIAIAAARTSGALLTANRDDMLRWARLLRTRARLRVDVLVPSGR